MYEQCHSSLFFFLFFIVTLHVKWLYDCHLKLNQYYLILSVLISNMININKHNFINKSSLASSGIPYLVPLPFCLTEMG